jgi:non-heme chloroperoxidase
LFELLHEFFRFVDASPQSGGLRLNVAWLLPVTDPADRIIVEAVFGTYVGMTKNRIERIKKALAGAHVVEYWGANHFVFLSNEADVLRELRAFLPTLR